MADAENKKTKTKSKTGWTRILLVGSLAFNLLIVGLVAGVMIRGGPGHGRMAPPLRDLGYGPYGQAFSQSDRHEIARAMEGRAGDLRANRSVVREQIKTLLNALREVPFDPSRVRTIVAGQRDKLMERHEIGQTLLLERIEAMDDHERAGFADRLEKHLRRGPGRRHDRR